jgi:mannose-6-phosphate isomerase
MRDNLTIEAKPYLLENTIQNYAWGTKGEKAFIPKLLDFEPEAEKAYAELWIGAHPLAPSMVKIENIKYSFERLVNKFPLEILGKRVAEKFGSLPFLLKVLSAGGPLSIQAHPSKEQAKRLHLLGPQNYPDENHKPEIAIVLDQLTALVGFKDKKGILALFECYPEIVDFLSEYPDMEKTKSETIGLTVKMIFSKYMELAVKKPEKFEKAVLALNLRIQKKGDFNEAENLYIEMLKKYGPRDVGLFSIFLLNLLHFKKGDAIFLSAGIPHAYISGNMVECMANSDNVVRAGLTPKFTDVANLLEIVNAEKQPSILKSDASTKRSIFDIDVDDFAIEKIELENGDRIKEHVESVQILLVTEGSAKIMWDNCKDPKRIKRGDSILIPAILNEYSISADLKSTLFLTKVP